MNISCGLLDRQASIHLLQPRLSRCSLVRSHKVKPIRAGRRQDDEESRKEISDSRSESERQPGRMLSSRQHLAERKAKQAGYVALRGPGQDVLPSEREREQRAAGASSDGAGGSGAAPSAGAVKPGTAAAKAAARRAQMPRPQGPPVPTIAPGQVRHDCWMITRRARTTACACVANASCMSHICRRLPFQQTAAALPVDTSRIHRVELLPPHCRWRKEQTINRSCRW